MAQIACLNCYRKHVATAMVFEDEANIGFAYPIHKWFAIGELNAAAKEISCEYPILAQMTREASKAYELDCVPVPTEQLIQIANDLEKDVENEETPQKDVSETLNNIEDGE